MQENTPPPSREGESVSKADWSTQGARSIGLGLAAGLLVGFILGFSLDSYSSGVAIGLAAGTSVGAAMYLRRPPHRDEVPRPPLRDPDLERGGDS